MNKLALPVFIFACVVALTGIIMAVSQVPVTADLLGCGEGDRCLQARLVVDSEVYSDTFKWNPLGNPLSTGLTLPAGTEVGFTAYDDFQPHYGRIVFPAVSLPDANSRNTHQRGWVALENLEVMSQSGSWILATDLRFRQELPIVDQWESSYP